MKQVYWCVEPATHGRVALELTEVRSGRRVDVIGVYSPEIAREIARRLLQYAGDETK